MFSEQGKLSWSLNWNCKLVRGAKFIFDSISHFLVFKIDFRSTGYFTFLISLNFNHKVDHILIRFWPVFWIIGSPGGKLISSYHHRLGRIFGECLGPVFLVFIYYLPQICWLIQCPLNEFELTLAEFSMCKLLLKSSLLSTLHLYFRCKIKIAGFASSHWFIFIRYLIGQQIKRFMIQNIGMTKLQASLRVIALLLKRYWDREP